MPHKDLESVKPVSRCILSLMLLLFGPHGPGDIPIGLPLSGGVPLVVGVFAFGDADLDFDVLVLEVHFQGHQSVAFDLGAGRQLSDLFFA